MSDMRPKYMSDGYIYETVDGEFYGINDAGGRVWDDLMTPGGNFADTPEEYNQIAWQVLHDWRTSREVEDDPY